MVVAMAARTAVWIESAASVSDGSGSSSDSGWRRGTPSLGSRLGEFGCSIFGSSPRAVSAPEWTGTQAQLVWR